MVGDLFLNVKNTKLVDIPNQICEVYGKNVLSDSMVIEDGCGFSMKAVHDEERTGRPYLVNDYLMREVEKKI